MSVPTAVICSPTWNGLISREPPPGWPKTPPDVPTSAPSSGSAGRSDPAGRGAARSRTGSNATAVPSIRLPSDSSTSESSSPATTWALVTTRSSATKKPLPSWIRLQASPSTFTVEAATVVARASESPLAPGTTPGSGAGLRASKTRGKGLSPTRRRSACSVSGASGKRALTSRAITEPRACSDTTPCTSANAGSRSHSPTSTPAIPSIARAPARDPPRRRRPRGARGPEPKPVAGHGRSDGEDDQQDVQHVHLILPQPPRSPASPMAFAATIGRRWSHSRAPGFGVTSAQEAGAGQEARVSDHAMVGPYGLALDVPAPVEDLDRVHHAEPIAHQLVAELDDLGDLWGVRHQHAAPVHGAGRVLGNAPGLRQVGTEGVGAGLAAPLGG